MKSTETIASRARAIALELFDSLQGEELERVMDLGLPGSVFLQLAVESTASLPEEKPRQFFSCGPRVAPSELSGLKPRIFLPSGLSSETAVALTTAGIFELARQLFLAHVSGADRSDLDVWISQNFSIELREVSEEFLSAYGGDRSMLGVTIANAGAALCSFTALRRLVLTDG